MEGRVAPGTEETAKSSLPVILLCGVISVIDGFDQQAIAFAAGSITREWNLSESSAGTFFSAGYAGAIIGAIVAGYVYRLLGKRGVLSFWLAWVGAGSLLNAVASGYISLILIRIMTGVGLGALIPILIIIAAEGASSSAKARAVAVVVAGSPLGGVICGIAYGLISVDLGWRSIFVMGAILPLLLIPAVLAVIPRSSVATTVSDGTDLDAKTGALAQTLRSVAGLFSGGKAFMTIAIMAAAFSGTLLALTLIGWTPLLLQGLSLSERMSAAGGVALNSGAFLALFGFGYLLDRFGSGRVIVIGYMIGCAVLLLSSYASLGVEFRLALVALAGLFAIGPVSGVWHLISSVYPGAQAVDATSIGLIAARVGGVAGPIGVGLLMDAGFASGGIYVTLALVAAFTAASISLFLIGARSKARA